MLIFVVDEGGSKKTTKKPADCPKDRNFLLESPFLSISLVQLSLYLHFKKIPREMSQFIKNLKSLFVVDEGGSKKTTPTKPKTAKQKPTSSTKRDPIIPVTMVKGKADEKFMNILLQALEKANTPGYDYLEFMNAIKSLEKMNMDEATRFKSAYTLAQTMGVTPPQLEKSARHYLDVLKNEEAKFHNALQNQQQNNIGKRNQEIQANQKAIEEKKKQIQNLQKEIENHQKHIQNLEKDLAQAKAKVQTAKGNFVASYQLLVNKIQEDITKMKQYLK